jgi:hypothetical protein
MLACVPRDLRLLVVAALLAGGMATAAVTLPPWASVLFSVIAFGLAAAGTGLAALAFERGDRLRWAWLAIAAGSGIGGVNAAVLSRPPLHTPLMELTHSQAILRISLMGDLLLNALTVLGLVTLGQAWRSLGPLPRWYNLATALAFGLGALVVGPGVAAAMSGGLAGDHEAWSSLVSAVGDLAAVTMVGPLAVTAVSMRGGALAWPYLLLAIGVGSWLAFDASALLSGRTQFVVSLSCAISALVFTGVAGVAQRRAIPR